MVRGMVKFREHFRDHTEKFVLIGGTACDLIMGEAGLPFRATKDLDIVLCTEAIDAAFTHVFWDFIRKGGYKIQEKATGGKQYFRFYKPEDVEYPYMLELFSRVPDLLVVPPETHLTRIPVDESSSCLSAILMDAPYYTFLHTGLRMLQGIPIVGPEHLIPLKARAYLDLRKRKENGERVDSRDIAKHRNDIFRLFRVIDTSICLDIPREMRNDMSEFLDAMCYEEVDLKFVGMRLNDILSDLKRVYY